MTLFDRRDLNLETPTMGEHDEAELKKLTVELLTHAMALASNAAIAQARRCSTCCDSPTAS